MYKTLLLFLSAWGYGDLTIANGRSSTLTPNTPGTKASIKLCITSQGQDGVCVFDYLCKDEYSVDERFSNSCLDPHQVCCLWTQIDPVSPKPTNQPTNLEQNKREGCGWRNLDGVGTSSTDDVDGESKFGEFPWMVAVLKMSPVNTPDANLYSFVGGGSLISWNVVLTAAHSVASQGKMRVRAGEWDTQKNDEPYPFQHREVVDIVSHKNFTRANLFNDVALLFLDTPMDPAPNVGLVCLPPAGHITAPGSSCFATSWGKDKFEKVGLPKVTLKKVEVLVVDHNTCQNKLRLTRLGWFFQLHTSFMCAGIDTCQNDGGSPLVCPIEGQKGRYVQVGIVSWGIACDKDGNPLVHVDVGNMRKWIDDQIAGKGYDPLVYEASTNF